MKTRKQQQTPAERIAQINQALDTLDENMFTMLRDVNDYAETHGWGNKLVERGLDQIKVMERRISELQEERRALYAATTAMAS